MKRLPLVLEAVGAVLLCATVVSAQAPAAPAPGAGRGPAGPAGRGAPPAPPQNLQVLPKDFTNQQVNAVMQAFAQGLGVTCEHCHVAFGAGDPRNDMASDMKPEKNKARAMMRMVTTVNTTLSTGLSKPAAELTQVQCVTCHRGVAIPKQLVDIVIDTGNQKGVPAAVAQYRDLRKQFYGSQAYDFSDATLFTAAQRSTAANKADDAIVYAQLNLEFNPNSARSHQAISQAYVRKMDTPAAIAALEKAVAMDPMNMAFQNQLNNLKNPPAPGQGRGGAGQGGGAAAPAPPARGQ
jgi:hypothetical protein